MTCDDSRELLEWLNTEQVIAFIVSDGKKRWRAVKTIDKFIDGETYCLWHIESGPLPLLRKILPDGKVKNPWAGWLEKRTGQDPKRPYFGAGHPGIYTFDLRLKSNHHDDGIGLSCFGWIGNWYKIIGNPAPPVTKKWWERLRRYVKKRAIRVTREGVLDGPNADVYVFPTALEAIKLGKARDNNI